MKDLKNKILEIEDNLKDLQEKAHISMKMFEEKLDSVCHRFLGLEIICGEVRRKVSNLEVDNGLRISDSYLRVFITENYLNSFSYKPYQYETNDFYQIEIERNKEMRAL